MSCKYVSIEVLTADVFILFCILSVLSDEEIYCEIWSKWDSTFHSETLKYGVIMIWIHIYCMYVELEFIFWKVGLNESYCFNWRSFVLPIKPQLKCLSFHGIYSRTAWAYRFNSMSEHNFLDWKQTFVFCS